MKHPRISLLLFPWLATAVLATQTPVANDDMLVAVENTRFAITDDTLLANDEYTPNHLNPPFLLPWSLPTSGELDTTANDTEGFIYDPDPDFFGRDAFTYTLTTSAGISAPGEVHLWTAPWRLALAGNWDGAGDDVDKLAWFSNSTGRLFLCDSNVEGLVCTMYTTDLETIGRDPLAMDWDGDGVDEIALFDPADGSFALTDYEITKNTLKPIGNVVLPDATGQRPVAGDWDGDSVDTIGFHEPATGRFRLRDSNTAGPFDHDFVLTGASDGLPVVGDWDNNGTDNVGVYDRATGEVHLSYHDTGEPAQISSIKAQDVIPLSGRWKAGSGSFVAIYDRDEHVVTFDLHDKPRVVHVPEDPCD